MYGRGVGGGKTVVGAGIGSGSGLLYVDCLVSAL